jgi:flagellar protein FlgJ
MPRGPGGEPSYNLFGIKAGAAWRGDAVNSTTTEYEAGVAGTRVERFRAYGSAAGGISDYVELLKGSPRYAAALGTGGDSGAFALALQRGGYATDPDYARKLSAVADGVGAILDGGLKPGNELPIPPAEGTT